MKTRLKKIGYVLFTKLLYRVEFIGRENIDMTRSNVLVANHVSSLDPILFWADIENLCIMAKEELFKNKLIAKIITSQGAFPIARGKKDFSHVYHAVNIVKANEAKNLLIFPEGTRKAKLKNVKAKKGAIYVAATANVPIIPIHITEKIKLFGKVKVEYGKPILLDLTKEQIKDKELLNSKTQEIMNIIYDMKG